ncbi:hypothetical protein T310_2239 [Rasamsonia emersonii CBS 393.64]|uniref:Calcineurin-like phosphoesterase domain-containing protein n=1 Tax=Rasamsonia emersonii (strain ATCC 16479 / CBS 393.64 / IMI 116815) TaxID=1408163 RepID=A0A0F4YZT3_RASE3|nr:hypothetical protein T310_2239 [Rasamsonia emersonii CBS 393.64]KKA23787.1 hypothetical protein T310_2239 [Rasamsonia emersonii CBS 393.64]
MVLSLILSLGLVASATALAIPQPLRFTKEGTFQLSVFSDLHYGEEPRLGPAADVNSTRVMNAILSVEHPQLVVLNGDLITGENTYRENSSWYVDEIVAPLVERGLPWASTYGNHDRDYNLSRAEIFAREKRDPNSLTQYMVPGFNAGVSNYYLPVFSSDEQKQTPEVILWFFDSRGGNYFQELDSNGNKVPQPGWVDESEGKGNEQYERKKKRETETAFAQMPVTRKEADSDTLGCRLVPANKCRTHKTNEEQRRENIDPKLLLVPSIWNKDIEANSAKDFHPILPNEANDNQDAENEIDNWLAKIKDNAEERDALWELFSAIFLN